MIFNTKYQLNLNTTMTKQINSNDKKRFILVLIYIIIEIYNFTRTKISIITKYIINKLILKLFLKVIKSLLQILKFSFCSNLINIFEDEIEQILFKIFADLVIKYLEQNKSDINPLKITEKLVPRLVSIIILIVAEILSFCKKYTRVDFNIL